MSALEWVGLLVLFIGGSYLCAAGLYALYFYYVFTKGFLWEVLPFIAIGVAALYWAWSLIDISITVSGP